MDRRKFIKDIGLAGTGVALVASPWLSVFSEARYTRKLIARIGIIGTGARGRFIMNFIPKISKIGIIAICDNYQPHLEKMSQLIPGAKKYSDYRKLLENNEIDAVIIATPLYTHLQIALDAFDAGKHVFCEKALAMTIADCYTMYQKHKDTGLVFFSGQQRLFDPRYIKAMELIHQGVFGQITNIRTFWYRNTDWCREIPSPELDKKLNWQKYKEYSGGLMSELACHQLQVGSWALRSIPNQVMGDGSLVFWKNGRNTYDNVNCIYRFDGGESMTFGSNISNKFYGLEEEIMGSLGTVEPEKGKYYFENTEPSPGFIQLVRDIENSIFETLPFAGTSWEPEIAKGDKGTYILGHKPESDGTSETLAAFAEAVITQQQPVNIAEEGYYASALALLGLEAMEEQRISTFPEQYKLNYLNHKPNDISNRL